MNPVYSRDECTGALRDFYAFLACMYMDPAFIIEPPQDGWPNMTPDATQGLGKTDEVIDLLRHLPYIANKPYSNLPQGLPGGTFIDWKCTVEELKDGRAHPDSELLISESDEDRFGAKIPAYCIGLVSGGMLFAFQDPDVILLDTRSGVVYWMNCPNKVRETASPQPSYLVYPLDGESSSSSSSPSPSPSPQPSYLVNPLDGASGASTASSSSLSSSSLAPSLSATSVSELSSLEAGDDDDDDDDEDEDDDDDDGDDDFDLQWGPCWPVRHFFEMLKNQFRQLNFLATDAHNVVDMWTDGIEDNKPIPEDFIDTLQAIYRKHGWPDVTRYQKDQCLAERERVLKERFPGHLSWYHRQF